MGCKSKKRIAWCLSGFSQDTHGYHHSVMKLFSPYHNGCEGDVGGEEEGVVGDG